MAELPQMKPFGAEIQQRLTALETTVGTSAGESGKLVTEEKLNQTLDGYLDKETSAVSITGDATGNISFNGSGTATGEIQLADSGATAGSYGPAEDVQAQAGGKIAVPYVTVDAKGRVTKIETKEVTLPDGVSAEDVLQVEGDYTGSKQAQRSLVSSKYVGELDGDDFTTGSGNISSTQYALNTLPGIPEGDYQLQNLLQMLVNCSHSHTLSKGKVHSNCNCDCACDCNCNDSDNA